MIRKAEPVWFALLFVKIMLLFFVCLFVSSVCLFDLFSFLFFSFFLFFFLLTSRNVSGIFTIFSMLCHAITPLALGPFNMHAVELRLFFMVINIVVVRTATCQI